MNEPAAPAQAIIGRARCVMDNTLATEDFGYQPRFGDLTDAFCDYLEEEARLGQR